MNQEFWLQLAGLLGGCVGVYAAIRADLAVAKVRAEQAHRTAVRAHARLDDHIGDHIRGAA